MDIQFCDSKCPHLSPKENHPHTNGHRCLKYKERLLHNGHHPNLVKLTECCLEKK